MSDHPSTFGSSTKPSGEQAWNDRATILPVSQDGQDAGASVPLQRGTFAQMIRHLLLLPEAERQGYVIQKAGDRLYSADEAIALASEPGFPAQDAG